MRRVEGFGSDEVVADRKREREDRPAAELEPVALAVVERAVLGPGNEVIDLAYGTGTLAGRHDRERER